MNKNNQTHGQYLAPQVKVVEMKVQRQILDASPSYSLNEIDRQDSDWDF